MTALVLLALMMSADPLPAAKGKCMLLEGGRVVEGEIERVDGQYRVQRDGSEIRLPIHRVQFVGTDVASVYRHLLTRVRPSNANDRVWLARWCLSHGLKAEAHTEATAALQFRPNDPSAKLLQEAVERLLDTSATATAAMRTIVQTAAEEPMAVESNSASYPLFASKVNAILVNRCASCHGGEGAGGLALLRGNDARSVRWNIAASLGHVNRATPAQSALLRKATTIHGEMARPPLESRDTAFTYLELWAFAATAPEGTPLNAVVVYRADPAPEPELKPETKPAAVEPAKLPDSVQSAAPLPPKQGDSFAGMRPVAAPAKEAEADDPFDPMIFNRQTGAKP